MRDECLPYSLPPWLSRCLIVRPASGKLLELASAGRAVSLGYDVTLVADAHMTEDSGGLTFEQIIAHHNALLDGFDAGEHGIQVLTLDEVIA